MHLIDFLGKPFVSTAVAIVGVVITLLVSYVLYRRTVYRRIPRFAWRISATIADINKSSPDLHLFWRDQQIPNAATALVAFWNAGKLSIRKGDISDDIPITFVPSEKATVLSVEGLSKSRSTLSLVHRIISDPQKGDTVSIRIATDDALEKDDGALFQILFTGPTETKWSVLARVFDTPRGFRERTLKDGQIARLVASVIIAGGGALMAGLFGSGANDLQKLLWGIPAALGMATSMALYTTLGKNLRVPKWARLML